VKAVTITDLNTMLKRQDLILNVKFKLAPSKRVFSRIKVDLYFDEECIKSFYLGVPYYFACKEELPIRSVLSLKQVRAGKHTVKVELGGLWPLAGPSDFKEATIDWYPTVRVPLVKVIPRVKKIEAPAIAVVTSEVKGLYEEMRKRWKRELIARREE